MRLMKFAGGKRQGYSSCSLLVVCMCGMVSPAGRDGPGVCFLSCWARKKVDCRYLTQYQGLGDEYGTINWVLSTHRYSSMMGLGEVDHGNLFSWVFRISLPCEKAAGGNDNMVQQGKMCLGRKNGGFLLLFIFCRSLLPLENLCFFIDLELGFFSFLGE